MPVASGHLGPGAVDDEVTRVEEVGLGGRQLAVGAAEKRPDARHEFAQLVGLGHVVVGAHLQTQDLVHLVALDGEHEDRLAEAQAAHLAAEVEAGAVRETDIEHDQAGFWSRA